MMERYPFNAGLAWDEWTSRFIFGFRRLLLALLGQMMVAVHRSRPLGAPMEVHVDRFSIQSTQPLQDAKERGQLVVEAGTVSSFCPGERRVELSTGCSSPCDLCVMATGFRRHYPFLKGDLSASLGPLHRCVLPLTPEAWGLGFVFAVSPDFFGINGVEMESRWLVHQWANGRCSSESQRRALVREVPSSAQCVDGVDNFAKTEALAADIGCLPRPSWAIFTLDRRARRVALATWVGPWCMQQYRLRGPHAKAEMAGEAILAATTAAWGPKFEQLALLIDGVMVAGTLAFALALRSLFAAGGAV